MLILEWKSKWSSREIGQDGDVERSWAHLLSWAHQNYRTPTNEKDQNLPEKIFYN